jgi:CDP-diacylglycerol--glycerol-3-phosphate 3-phosphatidyltransferase
MLENLRWLSTKALTPLAKVLNKADITPNWITLVGTILVIASAIYMSISNNLILGSILLIIFSLFDSLDGVLARLANRQSTFGEFLDSTFDRLSDAAVFIAFFAYFCKKAVRAGNISYHTDDTITIKMSAFLTNPDLLGMFSALALLIFAFLVSYSRAKSQSLKQKGKTLDAKCGIATRADRLAFSLVASLLVGLGLSEWILVIVLILLTLSSLVTLIQRICYVRKNTE